MDETNRVFVCASCNTFAPDSDDGLCWLCAHQVDAHGAGIMHAYLCKCRCPLENIYPKNLERLGPAAPFVARVAIKRVQIPALLEVVASDKTRDDRCT